MWLCLSSGKLKQLLVYELADSFGGEPMLVRVEFIAQESGTHVRLTQSNLPDTYSQFVMAGWQEGFTKLAT